MKKLKHDHVMAVHTAQLFLHKALDRTHEPRFQREVENDIALLGELRLILIHAIANPQLPFDELEVPDGPANGTS